MFRRLNKLGHKISAILFTTRVNGSVTLDGESLTNATLKFICQETGEEHIVQVDENGNYAHVLKRSKLFTLIYGDQEPYIRIFNIFPVDANFELLSPLKLKDSNGDYVLDSEGKNIYVQQNQSVIL
jgi:hypothetical protein